jgi:hypothetical protein
MARTGWVNGGRKVDAESCVRPVQVWIVRVAFEHALLKGDHHHGSKQMPIVKRLIRDFTLRLDQAPALKAFLKRLYHAPALKDFVTRIPIVRNVYAIERMEPIDIHYGINTSGYMPVEVIHPNKSLNALILP